MEFAAIGTIIAALWVVGWGMSINIDDIRRSRLHYRLTSPMRRHRLWGFSKRELAVCLPILVIQVGAAIALLFALVLVTGCSSPMAPTDCLDPAWESTHARVEGVRQGDPDYAMAVRWAAECPAWGLTPDA
jgi:hypothetical protein